MDDIIRNLTQRSQVIERENYAISNVSEEVINNEMRGWICGQFYPRHSRFCRDDVEIAVKILPEDFAEKLHYHLGDFEFVLILSGEVEYQLDGERHRMKAGSYYVMKSKTNAKIIQVHKKALAICVRLPSIPNGKFAVE